MPATPIGSAGMGTGIAAAVSNLTWYEKIALYAFIVGLGCALSVKNKAESLL